MGLAGGGVGVQLGGRAAPDDGAVGEDGDGVGAAILTEQQRHSWGDNVAGLLARDLRARSDPGRGFSRRNLFYMRQFAVLWTDQEFVQSVTAQIGVAVTRDGVIKPGETREALRAAFSQRPANLKAAIRRAKKVHGGVHTE